VSPYLRELCIDERTVKEGCDDVSFHDLQWAVETLVRFHTFVNRVGIEFSRRRSATEIDALMQTASCSPWRESFMRRAFAPIALLVAVADLIAVDDQLLTARKARETEKRYDTLVGLMEGTFDVDNGAQEGLARFRALLSDRDQHVSKRELDALLSSLGQRPHEFWVKFYTTQQFDFALSLVPFLPSAGDALLVFALAFFLIDSRLGPRAEVYENTRLLFDHRLDPDVLASHLQVIRAMHHPSKTQLPSAQDCWQIGGLEFVLLEDDSGHVVRVGRQGA
jgi:hypothetical protein